MKLRHSSLFILLPILAPTLVLTLVISCGSAEVKMAEAKKELEIKEWKAPEFAELGKDEMSKMILYGHELISNTSIYLGPKGKIAQLSNGMSCQNCHMDAGRSSFGNCFSAVASTFPKYRDRSGKIESIEFRIKECFERSLNGKSVDSSSAEMQAMVAYLKWIGKGVSKGEKPIGAGLEDLPFLERAADSTKGRIVYMAKCITCHGTTGQGQLKPDSIAYLYPPLWGSHSYNVSAGLFRLSRFAAFVKNNMPFGASHKSPLLSNEEAWDVAAYVNSQPRPKKYFAYDWPKPERKPVDYPFGPYKDDFSENQHKYGPFPPIAAAQKKIKLQK
jgi:thiosulfate dehydrogenase